MSAITQASTISLRRISPTTHSYIFEGALLTRIIKIALLVLTAGTILIIPLAYDAAVLLKNRIISSKSDKKASDNNANDASNPDASRITRIGNFLFSGAKATFNGAKKVYNTIAWGKSWTLDLLPKKVRWILVTSVALQVIRKTVGVNQFAEQVSPFTKAFFTAVIQPFFYATGQAGKEGFQAAAGQAPKAAQEFAQFVKENIPPKSVVVKFMKEAQPVVLDYASVTMSFLAHQFYEGWMQLPDSSQTQEFFTQNIMPALNNADNFTRDKVFPLVVQKFDQAVNFTRDVGAPYLGQKAGELANFTRNEVGPAFLITANNTIVAVADHFDKNSENYKNITRDSFNKVSQTLGDGAIWLANSAWLAANYSYFTVTGHFSENSGYYKNSTKNTFKWGVETTASFTKSGLKGFFKTLPFTAKTASDVTEYSVDTLLKTTKDLGVEIYENKDEIANSLSQTVVNLSPLVQRVNRIYVVVKEVRKFLPDIGGIKSFILDSFKVCVDHTPTFGAIYSFGRLSFDEYQKGNLGYSMFSGAFGFFIFCMNAKPLYESFSKVRFLKPEDCYYTADEISHLKELKSRGDNEVAKERINKINETAAGRRSNIGVIRDLQKNIEKLEVIGYDGLDADQRKALVRKFKDLEQYKKYGDIRKEDEFLKKDETIRLVNIAGNPISYQKFRSGLDANNRRFEEPVDFKRSDWVIPEKIFCSCFRRRCSCC
jgi:hypothetical protein